MPEDWEDEGPGPKVVFRALIPMFETTPRDRAWRQRRRDFGRILVGHNHYTIYSATQRFDGAWEGPSYTSNVDEYSDTIPVNWEEDQEDNRWVHLAMATDPPPDTPLTQLEPEDK